jgi:protein-S-isoprenylcysteine O-methyltransferase Ste14
MRTSVAATIFAWMGAALFLSALGFCGWSFVVSWRSYPLDAANWPAALTNVALFSAFALHHSVLARLRVREVVRRVAGVRLERSVYVWVASLLLIGVCWAWQPVLGVWWQLRGIPMWEGRILQLVGVALTLVGAGAIDVTELAGVRQAEGSLRAGGMPAEFKTTGVYGLVRHPIYLGWVLMVLAAPTMTATRGVFAVVSCVYLAIAIPLEEASLATTAGPLYAEYRQAVRWRLIPFLW